MSGVLVVISFPPFDFWYLGFIALVPFAIFLIKENSKVGAFKGGAIFGFIFSGYLSLVVLPSFIWIPQAYLFMDFMHFLPIFIVLFTTIWSGVFTLLFILLKKRASSPLKRVLLIAGIATFGEWIISSLSFGFNYGSFSYIGVHIPFIRIVANVGGALLVSFFVFFINVASAEIIVAIWKKDRKSLYVSIIPLVVLGVFLILIIGIVQFNQPTISNGKTVSIAIIQDNTQLSRDIFGETTNGVFRFDALGRDLREAGLKNPDIIIYPFSPWSGVITTTGDTSAPLGITITDAKVFGKWIKTQVAPKTVFVVWSTVLRNGVYTDEIEFWKAGNLIGSYKKQKRFPFMDYTPKWAENLGFYSTPINITAGNSSAPVESNGVTIGSLVCSEVAVPSIAYKNARKAGLVLAIGTEELFAGSIAETFNLMNTQLRATETARPFIRANILGPSAIINKNGSIISEIPYGENGILFGTVYIPTNVSTKE